jgi:Mg/Co/Ni transporter MgtE
MTSGRSADLYKKYWREYLASLVLGTVILKFNLLGPLVWYVLSSDPAMAVMAGVFLSALLGMSVVTIISYFIRNL